MFYKISNSLLIRTIILSPKRHLNTTTSSETEAVHNVNVEENLDEFTKEFLQNRIETSQLQKLILTAGSSLAALLNPRRLASVYYM